MPSMNEFACDCGSTDLTWRGSWIDEQGHLMDEFECGECRTIWSVPNAFVPDSQTPGMVSSAEAQAVEEFIAQDDQGES